MAFSDLDRTWEHLGETDAMWAVLTSPDKRFGRWDPEEFFATGRAEIDRVLGWVEQSLREQGRTLQRGRALDFGCGVGRLTRALAGTFERADGVDLAESMIEQARALNQSVTGCEFHVNKATDLSLFPDGSFDFIYTAHVLQHMEPQFQRGYVGEFLRVLRPGGVAAFEMVTERPVGADGPLPDDAFRAELAVPTPPQSPVDPGAKLAVEVIVTNRGSATLPAIGKDGWFQVTVGNHWLDAKGNRVVNDDGRAALPDHLPPGKSATVVVDVRAPAAPGRYRLEFDCVQEGVTWFADRGSATATVDVTVAGPRKRWWSSRKAPAPSGQQGHDVESAAMEMHGVPEADLRAWVTAAAGTVLASTDFAVLLDSPSPDWNRRIYLVTP